MFIDVPDLEALAVTFIVTVIRTILEASPTLVGGVAVAGYLRTQVEPQRLSTIFPNEGIEGIFRAALVATVLPVCSIGILPVLRELRRMGLSTSKLITLGLVAPLLNPFSVVYGLGVLTAPQFLLIVTVVGLLAITVGDVSSRFAERCRVEIEPRPRGLTGRTRIRNLFIAASHSMSGQILLDLAIVVAVSALTASFIRDGAFHPICEASNRMGLGFASALSLPQYVSPPRGVIQFAGIRNANLSIATGLAVYVFGTAISAATIATLLRWYGSRRVRALAISFAFVVCGSSYALSCALPASVGGSSETSALDGMTRPTYASFSKLDVILEKTVGVIDPIMLLSAVCVLVLFAAGLVVRATKTGFRDDDPEEAALLNAQRMSKALPASQLGATAVLGIGVLFVFSMFIVFPAPGEFFEEMETIQLDCEIAIGSGEVGRALDLIDDWDRTASRLPIGAAIRGRIPTPSQRKLTRDVRAELRRARTLLGDGELGSAREKVRKLRKLVSQARDAFGETSS